MNEQAIIKRKIQLKGQHLKLIRNERKELKHKLALVELKGFLESQITEELDLMLSRKLDCVNYLLDNWAK